MHYLDAGLSLEIRSELIFITYLATALFLLRAVGARLLQARFTFSDGTFGFAVIILSAEVMT